MQIEQFQACLDVAYFDRRLGASHSKLWLKYAISMFLTQKKDIAYRSILRLYVDADT